MSILDAFLTIPDKNEIKGSIGEWLAGTFCKMFTDGLVLHDVLIDGADGHTSQIDLILIGAKGLFVVEVKMFPEAKVYGDGRRSKWYYYKHGAKYEIYSPIRQNQKHIEYLRSLLQPEFGDLPFFSVITLLCDDFKVSNINPSGDKTTVVCSSLPAMKKGLDLLAAAYPAVLGQETKHSIYAFIQERQYAGKEARQQHKEDVRGYKEEIEKRKEERICPYCHVPLVERKGKFGSFYGCPNYPKCRYTQKGTKEDTI